MENPTQMTEERETVTTQDSSESPNAPSGTTPEQPRNGQTSDAVPQGDSVPEAPIQQPQAQAGTEPPDAPPAPAAPDTPQQENAQPEEPAQAQPAPTGPAGEQPAPGQPAPEQPAPEEQHAEPPPAEPPAEQTAEQAAEQTAEQPTEQPTAPDTSGAEAGAEAAAEGTTAEEATAEDKPEESTKPKTEGSMIGAASDGVAKDAKNPLGRPPSSSFDFLVSDEEFEEMIKLYCRDLTKRCAEGKEDPVIGRDEEVIKMSTILLQRGRSNVVLLAEGGVGKTALFSALAHYFVSPDVPDIYKGARVIDVDLTSMAAGTASRAEFEGRLKPFLQACTERNEERCYGTPIVICLDEVHTTMGSCKASSAAGVADVMKPALTAGNLYVVGATTVEEYHMYCKPDAAYDRRFQKIHVEEPSVEDTIHILKGLKKKYAEYHNLEITDELIEWHVPVVTKFLRKRMNPDKSIMMLDASCAEALKEGCFGGELTKEHCARAIGSEAGVKWQALIDE